MTLQACADLVRRGDPDRFAAAMAGPVEARKVLFPLYAFNLEVARAPWVASEPMIGEMRLQWWRDALEEIAKGGPVRRHEVTTPLGEVLDAEAARLLDRGVAARRWDLYREPFGDGAHFGEYLEATGGTLMWVAARALGAAEDARGEVTALGRAAALARFLQAVPELEARGRVPLVDGRAEAVRALAEGALAELPRRVALPGLGRAALLEGWQARPLLVRAARDPAAVAEGRLALSEFRKRLGLFLAAL
jgi:phytoene/squalene synthetase